MNLKNIPGLWIYLENGPWTLKISPVVSGLRVNIKNDILRRKCPFEGFWGFGQFGLFTLLTF